MNTRATTKMTVAQESTITDKPAKPSKTHPIAKLDPILQDNVPQNSG